jgi:ribosomal protein L5
VIAVTLRHERMYEFSSADRHRDPSIWDFRGISAKSFDGAAISRWASDHLGDRLRQDRRALDIAIATTARTDDEARVAAGIQPLFRG